MSHKFGTIMSVHFILDNDSSDAPYTGSRGDVFIRISKPFRKPLKPWVILIALQFRYTFYKPLTKTLRARKISLQYKIRKGRKQIWGRFSNL